MVSKNFYIVDHINCGAYGGNESTDDHRKNLLMAKKLIQKQFKNLVIHLNLANIKDGNLDLQKIK